MTRKTKTLIDRDFFVKSGRKGGLANSKKKNHAFFQSIGKKGAIKRWSKKKATDEVVPKSEDGLEKAGVALSSN